LSCRGLTPAPVKESGARCSAPSPRRQAGHAAAPPAAQERDELAAYREWISGRGAAGPVPACWRHRPSTRAPK
jgi:hypothetical protein